ncbi:HYC_CC_PP family protein [Fluviicola chungangensis]|uniref:Uncharacterized protein n=1 Tax=Fluviicola chungangensis TaxID=2597671 RepID=A0A556MN92_9FLAO|nr:hypothetical protein [Fluviicola chungangensis]TSJ41312.1 hypothetical protein FO442_15485 [Fluviicola chungangensis]
MKRILSLIIMVLYLLPALGMTVSTHFCGGRLTDVSLFGSTSKMNCSCGTTIPEKNPLVQKKCCEQLTYSLKLGNQQLKQSVSIVKSTDAEITAPKQFRFEFTRNRVIVHANTVLNYIPDLPPGRYKEPIYIQNDSFLI